MADSKSSCSFSVDMSLCNLNRLQEWIDNGRIDPTRHITLKELQESRCIHQVKDGVKLLARVSPAAAPNRQRRPAS